MFRAILSAQQWLQTIDKIFILYKHCLHKIEDFYANCVKFHIHWGTAPMFKTITIIHCNFILYIFMGNSASYDDTKQRAMQCLWNQLPASFHQPHPCHPPSHSSHPIHVISSLPSSPVLSSITPILFHSRLKTHILYKSFLPQTLHHPFNCLQAFLQIQIQIKTYKAPVTMKSATGAVQMQIIMKIMVWNNDEIKLKCY